MDGIGQRLDENAFHVLGLRTSCSRVDAEREAQKILGLMELGIAQAREYESPLGRRPRTAELVRWAVAELRDPERRLRHEMWAQLEPTAVPPESRASPGDRAVPGVTGTRARLGWGAR